MISMRLHFPGFSPLTQHAHEFEWLLRLFVCKGNPPSRRWTRTCLSIETTWLRSHQALVTSDVFEYIGDSHFKNHIYQKNTPVDYLGETSWFQATILNTLCQSNICCTEGVDICMSQVHSPYAKHTWINVGQVWNTTRPKRGIHLISKEFLQWQFLDEPTISLFLVTCFVVSPSNLGSKWRKLHCEETTSRHPLHDGKLLCDASTIWCFVGRNKSEQFTSKVGENMRFLFKHKPSPLELSCCKVFS